MRHRLCTAQRLAHVSEMLVNTLMRGDQLGRVAVPGASGVRPVRARWRSGRARMCSRLALVNRMLIKIIINNNNKRKRDRGG